MPVRNRPIGALQTLRLRSNSRHGTSTIATANLAWNAVFAVALLSAEKVQVERIAMFGEPNRSLVEEGGPLERCTVKSLALCTVTMLGVDGVAMILEFNCVIRNGSGLTEVSSVERDTQSESAGPGPT